MKRIVLLILVLMMVTSFIVAFAEETPTTEQKEPKVIYTFEIEVFPGQFGIWEVMGFEDKQPLIFQDTAENPKTGFSRFTIEEIKLMPDGCLKLKNKVNPEIIWDYNHRLKASLLDLEKLYIDTTNKDGNVVRIIHTEKNSDHPKIVMCYTERGSDDKKMMLYVGPHELVLLYEHLSACLIDDLVPYIKIERIEGSTLTKLSTIHDFMHVDTLTGNSWVPRNVAGWVKKSQKQIQSDKEYVTELLLNVTKSEFERVVFKLMSIFEDYSYKFEDGHVSYIIINK
jgi:hypothetical protein